MTHLGEMMEIKINKLQAELDMNKDEQQKFFEIGKKRNDNYMNLNNSFYTHQTFQTEQLTKFKNEVNNSLVAQDQKLKQIHQYKRQIDLAIDAAKAQMNEKWESCTSEILEKLEVQELRFQKIEMDHLKVEEFMKKFTTFQVKVNEVCRQLDSTKQLPKFIERTIPSMIHF